MSRFNIHIDTLWSVPLLVIGATQGNAWVEIGESDVELRFGIGHERIKLADINSVTPHEWSMFYGIGLRIGYGGIGYVGSTERVVEIKLKQPVPFSVLPGVHVSFPSFFVSLDEPDAFIAAVRARLGAAS